MEKQKKLLEASYYKIGCDQFNVFLREDDYGQLNPVKRESKDVGKYKLKYNGDESFSLYSTKRHVYFKYLNINIIVNKYYKKWLYCDCGVFLFDAPNLDFRSAKFEFGPMLQTNENGKVVVRSFIRSLDNNEFIRVTLLDDGDSVGVTTVLDEANATPLDFIPLFMPDNRRDKELTKENKIHQSGKFGTNSQLKISKVH